VFISSSKFYCYRLGDNLLHLPLLLFLYLQEMEFKIKSLMGLITRKPACCVR